MAFVGVGSELPIFLDGDGGDRSHQQILLFEG